MKHSGVVLQGLTFARSGAIVAAPTTRPEGEGSGRTWDYRYTWLRDASMTMQGLFIAACPDEAGRYFSFLSRAAGTQLARGLDLQIMFGIGGERDLTERTIGHLAGWRNSGPVRVGNQAWEQRQLDVYGAVLDAAHTLRSQLTDMADETRVFLVAVVEAAATRWREPDQGIWEVRDDPKPYLHSKLMCGCSKKRRCEPGSISSTSMLPRCWQPRTPRICTNSTKQCGYISPITPTKEPAKSPLDQKAGGPPDYRRTTR